MLSLYGCVVPGLLQLVGSMSDVLDKGRWHAVESGADVEALADARLIDDMFPLHMQVRRMVDHSSGALADVAKGVFSPPRHEAIGYSEMQTMLSRALAELQEWIPAQVDDLQGKEFIFAVGSSRRVYSAEAYLLLFAIPNCYFHAVTAYDILRSRGVPIGKRDYLSQHRTHLGDA